MTLNEVENNNGEDSSGVGPAQPYQEAETPASGAKFDLYDIPRTSALEVTVDHSIEKAMKILKRKLIKEGLFKELKMRRYFEKPCERRKRKQKESLKKARKEASRLKKNPFM